MAYKEVEATNMTEFQKYCDGLTAKIQAAYEQSVSMEEAERLAAEFLHAQTRIGTELKILDLDARMRKTGVKATKAAVYLEAATKGEKKPSDVMLEAIVHKDARVQQEQNELDAAEVTKNELDNLLNVCREAHIFFRGVSKGRFE